VKNAFILVLLFTANHLFAQVSYVDPFIGTGKSNVLTRWGSEGGVYPGAVAPNGYMQLTPQTRAAGYDYSDSTISFFSCTRHFSGFPSGSAGDLWVMPLIHSPNDTRPFSHKDEKATPGYYSVLFRDNGTLVEMTATERAGMFRFTFPAAVTPSIYVNDFKAAVRFSEPYETLQDLENGYVMTFKKTNTPKVILLSVSASAVSKESAERNIAAELSDAFDKVKEATQTKWEKALSVITVTDTSSSNKTIFYTALYHSLLMPWIISDVDGRYRGADKQVHTVKGRVEYGGFSPWDTYRSLHPLLCLLFPDKQADMVASMLDIYQQTHFLPIESMTGNHSVPIIVDSYLKGIPGIDSALAYAAMKKSIGDSPHLQHDMAVYQQHGYIPFSYAESVTRTVEYAYDDWALAQFARQVMHNEKDYHLFIQRSYNYRNLFHAADMFMLPRAGKEFKTEPGNSGYKEGDKWVYTYFAPQHPQDLINLLGGETAFIQRLDTALIRNQVVFDNETVFHVPYLFNAAQEPTLTQYWIQHIMHTRFSATPGGLPGNDDLGSTSSWYVLSAMGFYPVAPGQPSYSIGVPLFQSMIIHLPKGKTFEIKRTGRTNYVGAVKLNNQLYNDLSLLHTDIVNGGEIVFDMTDSRPTTTYPVNKNEQPDFQIQTLTVSKKTVVSDEVFSMRFTIQNKGVTGTMPVSIVSSDGILMGTKNCLVDSAATIIDSITGRLYKPGKVTLIAGDKAVVVTVVRPRVKNAFIKITDLTIQPLIPKDSLQQISYTAQNTGPDKNCFDIPLSIDSEIVYTERDLILEPGEQRRRSFSFTAKKDGWHRVTVNKANSRFKTYSTALESVLLDLSATIDKSGFGNNAKVTGQPNGNKLLFGKDCFAEVPNATNLDVMGNTMTMMAWIYPTGNGNDNGLVDMVTKGDSHVLQTENGKTITFFAGGWGRGDVTVPLPNDWKNHWHHIAGVCYGDSLKLYIDGNLKGTSQLSANVNLSNINKWTLGRNEEFPSVRIFNGYIDNVKIFAVPLTEEEIETARLR
jgi:putative alpha-1,2-mannosidase